jgi:hypothetical protein
MRKKSDFLFNDGTLWEDTGKIVIHNYPPDRNTFSYLCKVYKSQKKTKNGIEVTMEEGRPFYFDELPVELQALAEVAAKSLNVLGALVDFDNQYDEFRYDTRKAEYVKDGSKGWREMSNFTLDEIV